MENQYLRDMLGPGNEVERVAVCAVKLSSWDRFAAGVVAVRLYRDIKSELDQMGLIRNGGHTFREFSAICVYIYMALQSPHTRHVSIGIEIHPIWLFGISVHRDISVRGVNFHRQLGELASSSSAPMSIRGSGASRIGTIVCEIHADVPLMWGFEKVSKI